MFYAEESITNSGSTRGRKIKIRKKYDANVKRKPVVNISKKFHKIMSGSLWKLLSRGLDCVACRHYGSNEFHVVVVVLPDYFVVVLRSRRVLFCFLVLRAPFRSRRLFARNPSKFVIVVSKSRTVIEKKIRAAYRTVRVMIHRRGVARVRDTSNIFQFSDAASPCVGDFRMRITPSRIYELFLRDVCDK